jgi:hypothetical protein
VIAAVGTTVVWLRLRRGEWEPGISTIVVVAALAGMRNDLLLPTPLVVAIALLALGEYLTRAEGVVPRLVALVPGAIVLGAALPDGWPFWMRAAAAVAAALGGFLAVDADRLAPRLVPPLFAFAAIGVWACVPDTEVAKAVLGAALAGAAIGLEPMLRHRVGMSAVTGTLVWAAVLGGVGRNGSVVGGLGCLGVIVLLPLVPRWRATRWTSAVAVLMQVALVVFLSRKAGFETSASSALLLAAPAFVVGWLALTVLRRRAQ